MDFSRLAGQRHRLAGVDLRFELDNKGRAAVWRGGEGYAARVTISDAEYVLKSHFLPCIERRARTAFLAALDLGGLSGCYAFWGAPVQPIVGPLEAIDGADVGDANHVEGYISRFFHGQELDARRAEGWTPEMRERIDLALQLCLSVEVLEKSGIVHGDLSPANIMIGYVDGAPVLCLIDFDGFYHSDVPLIPVSDKAKGGRPRGTPGFKSPAFRGRDAVVSSDRLALAILVTELVVLAPDDWRRLGRDEPMLLSQATLNARVLDLPDDIIERWPEGFQLLRRAIEDEHPAHAPGPADWGRLLEDFPIDTVRRTEAQHSTMRPRKARSVRLSVTGRLGVTRELVAQEGDLGSVHPLLSWLSYRDSFQELQLRGNVPPAKGTSRTSVFVRYGGNEQSAIRYDDDITIALQVGDVLVVLIEGKSIELKVGQHGD